MSVCCHYWNWGFETQLVGLNADGPFVLSFILDGDVSSQEPHSEMKMLTAIGVTVSTAIAAAPQGVFFLLHHSNHNDYKPFFLFLNIYKLFFIKN